MNLDLNRLKANLFKAEEPARPDYTKLYEKNPSFIASMYLFECAAKLKVKQTTAAIAATFLHRVFRNLTYLEYDRFVFAVSCIYLAGKVNDDPVNIRDVINVSQNTLRRDGSVMNLGSQYWGIRDSIVQTELLIMRALKFDVNVSASTLPHTYLLHYIKSLDEWFGKSIFLDHPISKVAFSALQDFHHSSTVLLYKPHHIAIGCLFLAIQVYGLKVPLIEETDSNSDPWFNAFVKEMTMEKIWEIVEQIVKVYEVETDLDIK